MNPVIRALHELGGSGTVREIENSVVKLEKIPNKVADISHDNGSSTEVGYRLAWALLLTCNKSASLSRDQPEMPKTRTNFCL
jgi:hypothetical protein